MARRFGILGAWLTRRLSQPDRAWDTVAEACEMLDSSSSSVGASLAISYMGSAQASDAEYRAYIEM